MRNRTMCLSMVLLSSSLLFTIPTATKTPLANNIKEEANVKEMLHKDRLGLLVNPIQEQFEKDRIEFEKLKLQKVKELGEQNSNEPQWQEFIVTFYTGLDEENSKYGAVNCRKLPLERGMVANNVLPYGTKIYLDNDFGIRTISDTGGKNFNSSNRIDMFVERWIGESKEQWRRRAESYGIKKIRGYIIK